MGCKAGWLDNSSANSLNFDNIKDYPAGFRLVSLALANYKRTAIAFGISPEKQTRGGASARAQHEIGQDNRSESERPTIVTTQF
jgi:hypothetical protein